MHRHFCVFEVKVWFLDLLDQHVPMARVEVFLLNVVQVLDESGPSVENGFEGLGYRKVFDVLD